MEWQKTQGKESCDGMSDGKKKSHVAGFVRWRVAWGTKWVQLSRPVSHTKGAGFGTRRASCGVHAISLSGVGDDERCRRGT